MTTVADADTKTPMALDATYPEVALSARESTAFSLYASGLTLSDVAIQMGVGETSVQTYIKRVRKKYLAAGTHLANKVEMYRAAQSAGLV